MERVTIKVVNTGNQELPKYETPASSGMDLRANLKLPVTLQPMERMLIPTGIHIALPDGYEAQVRSRSGLALKHGVVVTNGVGSIDADYNGDIGVILINFSEVPFTIQPGDRIAQLVISPIVQAYWEVTDTLEKTERGENGFGHTGLK